jgi:HPt (histidine-containing phosphotransfer) domain-containing protein
MYREDCEISVSRSAAEIASAEVLDWHGLCDRCMGNLDLVERVLAKFQQQLPEALDELEEALRRGDALHLARVAHRIKGTSASVSAATLQKAAEQVEELGRDRRLDEVPERLGALRSEWLRVSKSLESRP